LSIAGAVASARDDEKERRMVFKVLAAASLLATTGVASAFTGKCLIEVESKIYLDGPCNIEVSQDGSFSVGAGENSRSDYFAYVHLGPAKGKASAYWNGERNEGSASVPLGDLERDLEDSACWRNHAARTRICAWQ
jgi:hypothetical protein